MASSFEEPGFVTPNAPQHQFGAQREFHATQDWQAQLNACGIDPNNLASQVFRPWEFVTHSAQSSHRERSRGVGKGGKGGKREGKHPRPQGAGPGTGKSMSVVSAWATADFRRHECGYTAIGALGAIICSGALSQWALFS